MANGVTLLFSGGEKSVPGPTPGHDFSNRRGGGDSFCFTAVVPGDIFPGASATELMGRAWAESGGLHFGAWGGWRERGARTRCPVALCIMNSQARMPPSRMPRPAFERGKQSPRVDSCSTGVMLGQDPQQEELGAEAPSLPSGSYLHLQPSVPRGAFGDPPACLHRPVLPRFSFPKRDRF